MRLTRVGKIPVSIPSGVKVEEKGPELFVEGPKGKLSQKMPTGLKLRLEEGQVVFDRDEKVENVNAFHGLARVLVQNMVIGVTDGFEKKLEIIGVGYRAQVKGKVLVLNLGFSHPVEHPIPEGIDIKVEANTKLTITGADKQKVGQVAAEIRAYRPPEPYKGKGVKYADEIIVRKAGKASGK
jgi:large subunit ribosomal protein L6